MPNTDKAVKKGKLYWRIREAKDLFEKSFEAYSKAELKMEYRAEQIDELLHEYASYASKRELKALKNQIDWS